MKHAFFSLFLLCVRGHDIVPVTVMEGDSVTLFTDIKTIQQEVISWYFSDFCIADITGDQSKISTDVQCVNGTKIFSNGLEVNNQTGSLTITNTRTTHSGLYKLQINSSSDSLLQLFNVSVYYAFGQDEMKAKSVNEGESVILGPGVKTTNDLMKWLFGSICIAEMKGDLTFNSTDVQCKDADERFRDRLKLDNQTGSLTITNTRTTDSGLYQLQISSKRFSIMKSFNVNVTGYADAEKVSVTEGDSMTLYTDVETIQQEQIKWYFNEIKITRDANETCRDAKCKDGTERFGERLQVNYTTGSLSLTNTRITDSGLFKLQISNSSDWLFSVSVFYASERDKMKTKSVQDGESVILDPGLLNATNYLLKWLFNDVRIADITGDQNSTEVQSINVTELFRNRLKVNMTGSLTITNITTTDSGLYTLQIISSRFSIMKSFIVKVTDVSAAERDEIKSKSAKEGAIPHTPTMDSVVSEPVLPPAAVAGIVCVVIAVLLLAVVGVIYYHKRQTGQSSLMLHFNNQMSGTENPIDDSCHESSS